MSVRRTVGLASILFSLALPSRATTVAVFVTQYGIVLGTDSKFVKRADDFSSVGAGSTSKFAIVQDRIVIADIGVSDFQNGSTHYNFLTWIQNLQNALPRDISVDDFAALIQKESAKVFAPIDDALRSGTLRKDQPDDTSKIFVQYIIAGYQNGIPKLYEVQFYIEWMDQTLVGPQLILLDPIAQEPGNFHIHLFGIKEALTDMVDTGSYAHRQMTARYPQAFGDLMSHRVGSLDETATLARAFIQIEENTNPGDVAGEITIAKVLPNGIASRVVGPSAAVKKVKRTEARPH